MYWFALALQCICHWLVETPQTLHSFSPTCFAGTDKSILSSAIMLSLNMAHSFLHSGSISLHIFASVFIKSGLLHTTVGAITLLYQRWNLHAFLTADFPSHMGQNFPSMPFLNVKYALKGPSIHMYSVHALSPTCFLCCGVLPFRVLLNALWCFPAADWWTPPSSPCTLLKKGIFD